MRLVDCGFYFVPKYRSTEYKVYSCTNLQSYMFTGLRVCRSANLQACKSASIRVHKSSGLQVYQSTSLSLQQSHPYPLYAASSRAFFKLASHISQPASPTQTTAEKLHLMSEPSALQNVAASGPVAPSNWSTYLYQCGITTNPFHHTQWEKNSPKYLEACGINATGAKMKFSLSPEVTSWVTSIKSECEYPRWGNHHMRVSVISSGPGGGKTRLLLELLSLPLEFDALYYVTFNNMSPISPTYDRMQNSEEAEKSIAMRILYQAILVQGYPDRQMQPFHEWREDLNPKGLKDVTRITNAIELLGGDRQAEYALAVDEANQIEENGIDNPGAAMYSLIQVLGEAMLDTKVFSFVAGTRIGAFHDATRTSGTYGLYTTHLELLTSDQQYSILDHIPSLNGWRCCRMARSLLLELGGLPQLLEAFIEAIVKARGPQNVPFGLVNWNDVIRDVRESPVSLSLSSGLSVALSQSLVDRIILREPVSPRWPLVGGQPETYESLQHNSQVVLQPHPYGPVEFIPTMPLVAFRLLVKTARQGLDNIDRFIDLDMLMNIYKPSTSEEWTSFEEFAISHTALMNEFFAKDQKKLKDTSLFWRYARGYGGAGHTKIKFVSQRSKVHKCCHEFPTRPSIVDENGYSCSFADGNCYLNAKGASFADGFYVCNVDVDYPFFDASEDTDTDDSASEDEDTTTTEETIAATSTEDKGAVTEDTGAPERFPPRRIFIAEQYNCTGTNLKAEKAGIDEHKKNLDGWKAAVGIPNKEDYRVITVVITTCQVPPPLPKDAKKYKNILVIDVTMFKDLYGILAPLVPTERIAINTMTWPKLVEIFGEEVAERIRDVRSTGFKDSSDFRTQMAGVGTEIADDVLSKCDF